MVTRSGPMSKAAEFRKGLGLRTMVVEAAVVLSSLGVVLAALAVVE